VREELFARFSAGVAFHPAPLSHVDHAGISKAVVWTLTFEPSGEDPGHGALVVRPGQVFIVCETGPCGAGSLNSPAPQQPVRFGGSIRLKGAGSKRLCR
jgi:hypothetical protein